MLRLIDANGPASWQRHPRDGSPSLFVDQRARHLLLFHVGHELVDVVAHQEKFVRVIGAGWMDSELGWWQSKDQPTVASVDRTVLQHVPEKRTVSLGVCALDDDVSAIDHGQSVSLGQVPRFLLIVHERVRVGSEAAYDDNERQIAMACASLKCPHPYIALATDARPVDVWWLNTFASVEERHRVEASYAGNEPLMAAIAPLGARKDAFRYAISSTMTEFRSDLSASALRLAGARLLVVTTTALGERPRIGAVFQATDGTRFTFAAAHQRDAAENLSAQMGPSATLLRVRPEWSFPDETWIAADRGFWKP